MIEWGNRYAAHTPSTGSTPAEVGAAVSGSGGELDVSQYVEFAVGPVDVRFEKKLFYPSISVSWRPPGVSSTAPGGTQVDFSHSVTVTSEGQGWNQITSVRYDSLDYRIVSAQGGQADLASSGSAGTYFAYRPLRLAGGVVLVVSAVGAVLTVGSLTGLITLPAWLDALRAAGG
jgi:hypothetical protein